MGYVLKKESDITQERECLPIHRGVPHQQPGNVWFPAHLSLLRSWFTTQQAVIKVGNAKFEWDSLPAIASRIPHHLWSFQDVPDQVSLVRDGLCYCSFKANLASAWLRDRPKIRIHTLVPLPNMDFEAWKHRIRVQVTGFSGEQLVVSITCDSFCSDEPQVYRLIRFSHFCPRRGPNCAGYHFDKCGAEDARILDLVPWLIDEDSIKYWTSQYTWHLFRCAEGTKTRINVLLCFCMCFYQSDWFPYIWYLLFSSRTLEQNADDMSNSLDPTILENLLPALKRPLMGINVSNTIVPKVGSKILLKKLPTALTCHHTKQDKGWLETCQVAVFEWGVLNDPSWSARTRIGLLFGSPRSGELPESSSDGKHPSPPLPPIGSLHW